MSHAFGLPGLASHRSWVCLLAATLVGLALTSCSETPSGPPPKATVPVTGEVRVDGQPMANVMVCLQDVKGIDRESPTFPQAMTDADGKFHIATYTSGDGAPEGTYQVTFRWLPAGPRGPVATAPDKLRGRYSNPATSKHRVTVTAGTPVELDTFQLTSK